MIELITKGLAKIVGTKSERDIKLVMPFVAKTKQEFEKLQSVSDDELRQKTHEIKSFIDERLLQIDVQIKELKEKVDTDESLQLHEKEEIFTQIDKLEEDRNEELEKVLLEVLPLGFAVVKETARRFKENKKLVVTATLFDKELAPGQYSVVWDGTDEHGDHAASGIYLYRLKVGDASRTKKMMLLK